VKSRISAKEAAYVARESLKRRAIRLLIFQKHTYKALPCPIARRLFLPDNPPRPAAASRPVRPD
jgi:hypothetical protein